MPQFSGWSSTGAWLTTLAMVAGSTAPLVMYTPASAAPLTNGEVSGFIRTGMPALRFRNQSKKNAPFEKALGEEFTFTANQSDELEFQVDPEDGSNLQTILVLVALPSGKQVAFTDRSNFLKYKVPTAGQYKLMVLAKGNTRGRYTLFAAGIGQMAATPQADQIMADVLKLRVLGCGVPNVARIKIGNEERCTRDIEAGQYTYDEASRSLRIVDTRRETIGQRLQLSMLEKCPPAGTATVKLNVTDNTQQFVYCATPNRFVKPGEYNYDYANDNLQPVGTGSVTSQPSTTPMDSRKQALQRDYGLQVMDTCPPLRTGLVVVAVQDSAPSNQGYVYCANPNRVVKAGEYVYNNATGNLETAQKTEQCTISLGGVCIVK